MNYEIAGFWLGCIEFVLISIIGLSHFYFKKEAATTDKLNTLEQKIDKRADNHTERLTVVETSLKHAINTNDLDKLSVKINELIRDLKDIPTRDEVVRLHERIDSSNQSIKETNLLIGQLSGQIKQMNEHRT